MELDDIIRYRKFVRAKAGSGEAAWNQGRAGSKLTPAMEQELQAWAPDVLCMAAWHVHMTRHAVARVHICAALPSHSIHTPSLSHLTIKHHSHPHSRPAPRYSSAFHLLASPPPSLS